MQCHLLNGSDIGEELGEILEGDDLALVLRAEHRPNCLIQLMTHSVKSIKFEDGEKSALVSTGISDVMHNPFWSWIIHLVFSMHSLVASVLRSRRVVFVSTYLTVFYCRMQTLHNLMRA